MAWLALSTPEWLVLLAASVGATIGVAHWLVSRLRRRMDELMKKAKEAQALAYAGSLAGGLAHEIRNPLSTISIQLQLLQEDWADAMTDRERRSLAKVKILLGEAKRLEGILSDFLSFSAGHKLSVTDEDVNSVLDEVLDFIRPEAEAHGIRIQRLYERTLPLVPMDRNLVKQVFLNIAKNAREAMPKGGEILVRTAREGRACRVEIADTGEGIAPDYLDRIWRAYFTTKKTGTGLGLALAKRIVEEHEGTIAVTSELGKGTMFTIRLPLRG